MYKYTCLLLLSCSLSLFSQVPSAPDVLLVNKAALQAIRQEYRNNPNNLSPYLSATLKEAKLASA